MLACRLHKVLQVCRQGLRRGCCKSPNCYCVWSHGASIGVSPVSMDKHQRSLSVGLQVRVWFDVMPAGILTTLSMQLMPQVEASA